MDSGTHITTFLMFQGQAEEAMQFYVSVFEESQIVQVTRYGPHELGPEGTVQHALFSLHGQVFMCIDSPVQHDFTFTPAISLFVSCEDEVCVARYYERAARDGQVLMPTRRVSIQQEVRLGSRPVWRVLAAERTPLIPTGDFHHDDQSNSPGVPRHRRRRDGRRGLAGRSGPCGNRRAGRAPTSTINLGLIGCGGEGIGRDAGPPEVPRHAHRGRVRCE